MRNTVRKSTPAVKAGRVQKKNDWSLTPNYYSHAQREVVIEHILLHELGHHYDRITSRQQRHAGRGEPYAEAYALKYETLIWERCQETFDL